MFTEANRSESLRRSEGARRRGEKLAETTKAYSSRNPQKQQSSETTSLQRVSTLPGCKCPTSMRLVPENQGTDPGRDIPQGRSFFLTVCESVFFAYQTRSSTPLAPPRFSFLKSILHIWERRVKKIKVEL